MPSDVRVVGQKFFSKLNNGDDFTINDTTDFSQHLKGGVLEEIKAVFNVQVQWYLNINGGTSVIYIDKPNSYARLQIQGKNFELEGFSVDDTITISDPLYSLTGVISSLSIGEMVFSNVVSADATNGFSRPDARYYLTGTTKKTALKYDFGLIENNEPINFLSKLTNTTQSYFFNGISHAEREANPFSPLVFVDGESQGNNKAAYTGSASVAFVGYSANNDEINTEPTVQEFQIEHTFKINPIYRDGELDSLKGIDVPPLDIYNGESSLKYVFQTEFRTVLTNPNTANISSYDTQLGSVGYLDESYNGYTNNYTISNLVYTINGNVVDRIEVGSVTNVSYTISTVDNVFNNSTPIVVGHTAIIDSLSYSNSDNNYELTWTDKDVRVVTGQAAISEGFLKNCLAVYVSPTIITISYDIEFSSSEIALLSENQYYLLYSTIQNPSLQVDVSDKVTNRVDVNYYYKNNDVSGLFDFDTFEQYPHPEPFEEGVTVGFTDALTFNESGMMTNGVFWVLNSATLNDLKFDIAVYNFTDDTWNSLRSLVIDLSDQTNVNGIQQIELDTTRGYKLKDGSIFNYLKVSTGSNDGTKQYYNIQVGYRIPWQSWLEFEDAPTDFYDKSKSYNGLNQKASNYSMNPSALNYGIKVLFDATVDSTRYVKTSEEIKVYDYENDDQDPTNFTCEIKTYNEDDTPIANNIIRDGYTEIRAVFTPVVPPVFTSSVDMTEVSTTWNRYAHGNKFEVSTFYRLPNWINDQADNYDEFTGNNKSPSWNKNNEGLYNSTQNQITANNNMAAVYGCYSIEKYEYYNISGAMFSNSVDDDVIKLDLAFNTDEEGVESTLSLCATSGGVYFPLNPTYNPNDITSQVFYFPPINSGSPRVSLVYNYGKRDVIEIELFDTLEDRQSWADAGDCLFVVSRNGDDFNISINWTIDSNQYAHIFNYNLNDNLVTEKFKGLQNIGFSFFSQDDGGFKDVELTAPQDQFYTEIRIEPKDSQSDLTDTRISSHLESPQNNLLTQITGNEIKASLSWDGESFIGQCLVDTTQMQQGQDYNISAEIRPLDLEE